jgi:hypothetical protein
VATPRSLAMPTSASDRAAHGSPHAIARLMDSSPELPTPRKRRHSSGGAAREEDTIPELKWRATAAQWKFEPTPLPPECPGLLPADVARTCQTSSSSVELDSDFADEVLTHLYFSGPAGPPGPPDQDD